MHEACPMRWQERTGSTREERGGLWSQYGCFAGNGHHHHHNNPFGAMLTAITNTTNITHLGRLEPPLPLWLLSRSCGPLSIERMACCIKSNRIPHHQPAQLNCVTIQSKWRRYLVQSQVLSSPFFSTYLSALPSLLPSGSFSFTRKLTFTRLL